MIPKRETGHCKWCGKLTTMLATSMCDACWELDHRIRGDLSLTRKMLNYYQLKEEESSDHE